MKKTSRFLSVLTSVALALFLLCGAIAVPILWRGFYYAQIDALALPARTGLSPEIIREAFDAVMDYLVKGAAFSTGRLPWSESGMAHFADCKVLFRLDFLILGISAAILVLVFIVTRIGKIQLHCFAGQGFCFWAFVGLAAFVLILGVWAFIHFESLFTLFHTIFFPGKSNWIFDYRTDPIILLLPEDFWLRAAGLVGGVAFGTSGLLAVLEGILRRAFRPRSVYEEITGQK